MNKRRFVRLVYSLIIYCSIKKAFSSDISSNLQLKIITRTISSSFSFRRRFLLWLSFGWGFGRGSRLFGFLLASSSLRTCFLLMSFLLGWYFWLWWSLFGCWFPWTIFLLLRGFIAARFGRRQLSSVHGFNVTNDWGYSVIVQVLNPEDLFGRESIAGAFDFNEMADGQIRVPDSQVRKSWPRVAMVLYQPLANCFPLRSG